MVINDRIVIASQSSKGHDLKEVRVSAKLLGEMAMPNFCPRCFWLKLRCRTMPYQKFAGIAMILDSYTKRIVSEHYDRYHRVPKWFNAFGDIEQPVLVPHHTKFFILDKETNIRLSGVPDAIFIFKDGSYCIIDYKTARWTENQELILPMYQVQLNGYAMIAEHLGFTPVSKLGLLYFEAQKLNELEDGIDTAMESDGFKVVFSPRYLEVESKPQEIIVPLLKEARKLIDLSGPPPSGTECTDCLLLKQLIGQNGGGKIIVNK